jgi:hypothetical protein
MESFDKFYESVVQEGKRPDWNEPHKDSSASKANAKTKISKWASGRIEDLEYWFGGKKGAATKQNALENKGYRELAKWINKTDFISFAKEPRKHKVYSTADSGGDRKTNFDDKAAIFRFLTDGIPQYRNYGYLHGVALMYFGHKPYDLSEYVKNGRDHGVTESWPNGRPQLYVSIPENKIKDMAKELAEAYPVLLYNRTITKEMNDWTVGKLKKKAEKEKAEKKATHVPKKRDRSKGPSAAWLRRNT